MRHQSQCSAPWRNMMLFPYRFNCLCWKISMLLCWILQCWMWQPSRSTQREWPPWCSKLCRLTSENDVTPWEFCSTMLTAAIVMAPRSLIKTESRTTSRCGIRRFTQCQGKKLSNQPANEWPPIFALLLFASLSFQHDLAAVVFPFHVTNLKLPRYLDSVPSSHPGFSWNWHLKKTKHQPEI